MKNKHKFTLITVSYFMATIITPIVLIEHINNDVYIRMCGAILTSGFISFGFVCAYVSNKFPIK